MRTPNIETAVRLYYEKSELTSADIKLLFSCGTTTATRLKNQARLEMAKKGVLSWIPSSVNTKIAFETWGIDIADFERRLKKLRSLNIEEVTT